MSPIRSFASFAALAAVPVLAIYGCGSDATTVTPTAPIAEAGSIPTATTDGAVAACRGNQVECAGSCADLKTDRSNCGACGKACAAGQVCSGGTCALSCQDSLKDCDGTCRDVTTDVKNCGACGKACVAGQLCSAGACVQTCSFLQKACPPGPSAYYCANTVSDPQNCGECGTVCPEGNKCVAGKCELACGGNQLKCGAGADGGVSDGGDAGATYCVDGQNDENNCGACGNVCASTKRCSGGLCCDDGKRGCNGACINVATDPQNCGGCGVVCPNNKPSCTAGTCTATYPSCKALKAALPAAPSGIYSIDPDGDGGAAPYNVYCENTVDGGGWTVMAYLRASAHWNWTIFSDQGNLGDINAGFAQGATLQAKNPQVTEKLVVYLNIIENNVSLGRQWMASARVNGASIAFSTVNQSTGWNYRDSFGYTGAAISDACSHGCSSYRGWGMFSTISDTPKWSGTQGGDNGCRDGNNICWMARSLGCNVGSSRCAYLTGANEGVIYAVR